MLNADSGTGSLLDLALSVPVTKGIDLFTIIDNDGIDPIVGEFAGLPEGTMFTEIFNSETFVFKITYKGGDGNDVVLRAVPEPSTALLLASGLVALAARRRARAC